MICDVCGLNPCACDYITSLLPGGDFAWLASTVQAQVAQAFPHRAACPCPVCWSERAQSWEEWADKSRP